MHFSLGQRPRLCLEHALAATPEPYGVSFFYPDFLGNLLARSQIEDLVDLHLFLFAVFNHSVDAHDSSFFECIAHLLFYIVGIRYGLFIVTLFGGCFFFSLLLSHAHLLFCIFGIRCGSFIVTLFGGYFIFSPLLSPSFIVVFLIISGCVFPFITPHYMQVCEAHRYRTPDTCARIG